MSEPHEVVVLRRYRRRAGQPVTAIQLTLDFQFLEYEKWGGVQRAKPGDWLVENDGEVYTVDGETFTRTYQEVSAGRYQKSGVVFAAVVDRAGTIRTKEGWTAYEAGDFVVFNESGRRDGYAMPAGKFESLYDLAD